MDMERVIQEAYDNGYLRGYEKGKADRPRGEVDAVKEYEHQVHNLDQEYITLGEFDKRIEPLRHLHYDRPQGEWIYCEDEYGIDGYRCSNCGRHIPWDYQHKFINFIDDYHTCPFCDARMKGADDDTD